MFVREADEAVCLGPAIVTDARDGRRRSGYLDEAALERALVATGADAAWVGWGFVAERPEFAELCERLGIVFVGPEADVMRRLGDKVEAKRLAEEAGVPVAPWSGGPVDSAEAAARHAERDRLPADGQGDRRWRRPGHPPGRGPGRARGGVRKRAGRGAGGLRRRHRAARERDRARPPRRGAGDRRRPGHRVGRRRARLQPAAPPPEGDRGVAPVRR